MKHIFIDESGVHKKSGKTSVVLVYVMVDDLIVFEKSIVEAERGLGIEHFHWAHSAWSVRDKFVAKIIENEFKLKIAIMRNPFKESVVYERVLHQLITEDDIASVVVDGRKTRSYERRMKKLLRDKRVNVVNLRMANDKSYPVLRVADVCAGIVRYRDEHPENEAVERLYRRISKRISVIIKD